MITKKINWVFFGSSEFSVYVLDELKIHNILPSLIITTPDKPKGRKLVLTPTPVKIWAKENNIEVIEPASLKNNPNLISQLKALSSELFLVASYGKIIPPEVFEIPKHKTLNIHPSLLPKYRGASPIQSQILEDAQEVGVSIMKIDEGMDTGAIVVQRKIEFFPSQAHKCTDIFLLENSSCSAQSASQGISELATSRTLWPLGRKELEKHLAIEGARLFAHILPEWLIGAIDPIMQRETEATYCQKIKKEDGELKIDLENLEKNAHENLLKIKAFEEWPTAYFFLNNKRIIITDAMIEDNKLKILKVKPEGKNEMSFEDFLRGQR
ncbi:MAG: methionyl-tRNA formyltransferase [Patescibacteria group bacterium]